MFGILILFVNSQYRTVGGALEFGVEAAILRRDLGGRQAEFFVRKAVMKIGLRKKVTKLLRSAFDQGYGDKACVYNRSRITDHLSRGSRALVRSRMNMRSRSWPRCDYGRRGGRWRGLHIFYRSVIEIEARSRAISCHIDVS
jgi:hypothetical protein